MTVSGGSTSSFFVDGIHQLGARPGGLSLMIRCCGEEGIAGKKSAFAVKADASIGMAGSVDNRKFQIGNLDFISLFQ